MPVGAGVGAAIRIGTSGWEYAHWGGRFYPSDLPRDRWFAHYADAFDTVEINATFYRLPSADVFGGWARRAPDGFVFAVKASRYLTHVKRLREPEEPLERLWTRARRLGEHLGPMLYQLPPRWKRNMERLEAFLDAVPRDAPQAIEVRDARWYGPELDELLAAAGVGLCLHDMPGSVPPTLEPVGPMAYVRFHGFGAKYGGGYPDDELERWADRMAGWADGGRPVWAYFNNDIGGHAVRDAQRLRGMLERRR